MFRSLVFSIFLLLSSLCFSQVLQVTSVFPPQHDNTAGTTTPIEVSFNAPLDTTGIAGQFVILGTLRGKYDFDVSVSPALDHVMLHPARPFLVGEEVKVTARRTLAGMNGETFAGFNWRFNIQPTKVTPPHFSEPLIFSQFSGFSTDVAMYPADINGDGHIDLVISGIFSVKIALNDGMGNFSLHQQFPSSAFFFRAPDIPITDFDLDGQMELVTMQNLYELDDNDFFQLTQAMPLRNFRDVEDMNGDGYPDLISIDIVSLGPPEFKNNVTILYNDGSGQFSLADTLLTDDLITDAIAGDFNSDGVNDIAYSTSIYASPGGPDGCNSLTVIYMKSDGDTLLRRIYTDSVFPWNAMSFPFQVLSVEFNHDSLLDVFIASLVGDFVVLNNGNENFMIDSALQIGGGDAHHWTNFADLNNNGNMDYLIVDQIPGEFTGSCYYGLNPDGVSIYIEERVGAVPYYCVGGDFNADGAVDVASIWNDGLRVYINETGLSISTSPDVIPKELMIYQNYPNPFNGVTKLKFSLTKSAFVKSTIFDITGKEVRNYVKKTYPAGEHQLSWDSKNNDGEDVSSGIYVWKFNTNGLAKSIKLILIR